MVCEEEKFDDVNEEAQIFLLMLKPFLEGTISYTPERSLFCFEE
jgi:hypothetical protein